MIESAILSSPCDTRARFYRRCGAFIAMLAVAMIYRAETLTDWDSWDYAAQAICGHSSDLCLGRWWFIAAMRGAYLIGHHALGLPMLEGYLMMQMACAMIMAGALSALMALTWRLTKSAAAETIVAALILPGPLIGIYASAVMTEGLTVLMISLSFLLWERAINSDQPQQAWAWALGAGTFFGVAADIREPAVLLIAWPIVACLVDRPKRSWQLLAIAAIGTVLSLGMGLMGGWAWYPWHRGLLDNIRIWASSMAGERTLFPIRPLENINLLGQYAVSASPLAAVLIVPAMIWALLRRRRLFWLGLSLLPYAVCLLANHDLIVNPRFSLPMVWLMTPIVAGAITALLVKPTAGYRLRLATAMIIVVALGGAAVWTQAQKIQQYYFGFIDSQQRIYNSMLKMPEDSVVIAGPGTPVAFYLKRLGVKQEFDVIASGWGWPGPALKEIVRQRIEDGRCVYVNHDANDWMSRTYRKSAEWDEVKEATRDYEVEIAGWPMVKLIHLQAKKSTNITSPRHEDAGQ